MTLRVLLELAQADPFIPFRFVFDVGTEVPVNRRDQVSYPVREPFDGTVVVTHEDKTRSIVDLRHVALITVSAPKGGGF